jgi:hypothetical protein
MLTAKELKSAKSVKKIATTNPGTPLHLRRGDDQPRGDRDPRDGADDAAVDEGPPVHVAARQVDLLLDEPEEDHRRIGAEEADQRDQLADAGEHRDKHDHQ